jgi:uncharacterized membrane protein
MYKSTVAGHPLHPMLITVPAGLLPFSFVMDLMHAATGDQSYADAAYLSMAAGLVGGLAAGAAGAVDYMSLPSGTEVKRLGNVHASLNIGMMALYGINFFLRRQEEDRRPNTLGLVMNAVGTAGLLASAWYGGHMVYEHGVRVKGVDPIEGARDLQLPGDEAIAETFERADDAVPAQGPGE